METIEMKIDRENTEIRPWFSSKWRRQRRWCVVWSESGKYENFSLGGLLAYRSGWDGGIVGLLKSMRVLKHNVVKNIYIYNKIKIKILIKTLFWYFTNHEKFIQNYSKIKGIYFSNRMRLKTWFYKYLPDQKNCGVKKKLHVYIFAYTKWV